MYCQFFLFNDPPTSQTYSLSLHDALPISWGISESAYAFTDRAGNYQYRAFGVPGLGLKRGLNDDLVVAPYATALAALVDPAAAAENFARLAEAGLDGRFGDYEAIGYHPRSRDVE